MRRLLLLIAVPVLVLLGAGRASAEPLELSLALTPTIIGDPSYEAFSGPDLTLIRGGLDVRTEVADPGGFELLPLVGYRFGFDGGDPYNALDTTLYSHDISAGLRVRKEVIPWLAIFVEVTGGLLIVDLEADADEDYSWGYAEEARKRYTDRAYTWSAGGHLGVDLHLSKRWLKSRGVKRFNLGGELSGGYIGRGTLDIEPTLEKGEDNSIEAETQPWGQVNLSGWIIQIAATFRFF